MFVPFTRGFSLFGKELYDRRRPYPPLSVSCARSSSVSAFVASVPCVSARKGSEDIVP